MNSSPVDALTPPELRAWLVELRATLSPMNVAGHVRGLRAFGTRQRHLHGPIERPFPSHGAEAGVDEDKVQKRKAANEAD